jgi:hypothetical protein
LEAEVEEQTTLVPDGAWALDDETRHNVRMLRSRARSLVAQAAAVGEPLATAYRRRARELELEAFLVENRGAARVA